MQPDINEKLQDVLAVVGNSDGIVDRAKLAVTAVFKEEVFQQQALLLMIAKQKMLLLEKFVSLAEQLTTSITAEESIAEIDDYDIQEKIKLLETVVKNIGVITASTEIAKEMSNTLTQVERALDHARATPKIDSGMRKHLVFLLGEMQQNLQKKRAANVSSDVQ